MKHKAKKLNCNAFVEFYILEMIDYHLHYDESLVNEAQQFLPSTQYLGKRLTEYKDKFETAFALRLRDYLWFAAVGEARHSQKVCRVVLEGMEDVQSWSRGHVYREFVEDYPPTPENVKKIYHLYYSNSWDGSYGGDSWAKIVEAIQFYETLSHSAFIDHCADLQHNGGVAFDKNVEFWSTTGYNNINSFLNFKFHTKSVVFDLPRYIHDYDIKEKLSTDVIYLMNKLFAVTKQSPWYDPSTRIATSRFRWNLNLDDQYSGRDWDFGYEIEIVTCSHCGDYISDGDTVVRDGYGYTYCTYCCTECDDCGEWMHPNEADEYENSDGDYICESCSNNYKECDDCSNIVAYDVDLCEDCVHDCTVCGKDSDSLTVVYDLDQFHNVQAKTTPLGDTREEMCLTCVKKHLDAGFRFYEWDGRIHMSTQWDYLMSHPWGELLNIHLSTELSYEDLLPHDEGGY